MANSASQLKVAIVLDSDGLHSGLRSATRSTTRFTRSIHHSSLATSRFSRSLGGMTRAAVGAAAAAVPLSLAIRTMARQTVAFDASMRDVNSLTQLSEKRFQALSQSVLDLAGPTAQAPKTLADGLYSLVSSGFSGQEALVVLRAAAKAASAGLTTTATSSVAVAAALNAYRLPAKRARQVSDTLFKTVDRGVVTFEQLAKYIGDVLPFSASLGVGLRDVGAAIATMTKQGIGPPETMIRIKNVMVTMLKPSEDLRKTVKELGYDSAEAMIRTEGFHETLNMLAKTTGGSKEELAKLFPNIRALSGVLALTGTNASAAAEDLHHLEESSGATDRALSQQSQSISYQWKKLKATASSLAIEFGNRLVPTVRDFLKILNNPGLSMEERLGLIRDRVVKIINDLAPAAADAAGKVGVEIAKAMGKAFVETGFLGRLAIGALVIRSLGGVGAITSAGTHVGKLLSTGTRSADAAKAAMESSGLTASKTAADLTKFSSVATHAASALGKEVAAIAALVITIEGAMGAIKVFSPDKKGLNDYLDQTISRGDTIQAQIWEWKDSLGTLGKTIPFLGGALSIGDALGLGKLKDEKKLAEDLRSKLAEIGTADRDRFHTLRSVIRRRVEELNLTKEQAKEIEKIINASKVGRANARGERFDRGANTIASGALLGRDLRAVVDRQLRGISETYNRYTPRWREKVEMTLDAQIKATRDAWSVGGKLTREGQRRIQAIIARRAKLLASADPIGIARGVVNGWRKAREANQINVRGFLNRLEKMAPAARKQAGATMVAYARQLEKSGKLPDGTVARLRSKLVRRFGPEMWTRIKAAAASGLAKVDGTTQKTGKKFDNLADAAERANRRIKTSVASVPGPVRRAYGRLADYANATAEAFGSEQRVRLAFRRGGSLRGRRGLVPVALSPGELVSYKGREMYVPGRPEPRDSVLMHLPVGAKVFTADGQRRLALGASETEALRKQAPHFAGGGMIGDVPRPRLSGGSPVAVATGNAAIDRARTQAGKWIERLQPTLKSMEKIAAKFGLGVSSGYRPGDDGFHGINRARDFSGSTSNMGRFARYVGAHFTKFLLEGIYNPLLSVDSGSIVPASFWGAETWADHRDHVHIAMRNGGWVKTGFTVFDDPGGGYMGHLQQGNGYAELGTATSGGAATGVGYLAPLLGLPGELRDKFPLDVKINGRTKRMYKRDRGYGQGTSAYGIDIYKDSWRFFGLDANSKGTASIRPAATKAQIRDVLEGAGGVAGRIQRAGRSGGARGYLRAAKRNVRKARKLAKDGDIWNARDRLDKARDQVKAAIKNRRRKKKGDNNRTPRPTVPGTVGSLLDLAATKGISRDTRESLLSSALNIAQGTDVTTDDLAVLTAQRRFQVGIRKNANRRLAQATKKLRSGNLSKKDRRRWRERRNNALQDLGASASEIASINADIAESKGGKDTTADLASAMAELAAAIQEQNEIARGVNATSSREALRLLSDVISGQIVGKRVTSTTPQGVRY